MVINDPVRWRGRAREARALANEMENGEARDSMLHIAKTYEAMAEKAAARYEQKYGHTWDVSPVFQSEMHDEDRPEQDIKRDKPVTAQQR